MSAQGIGVAVGVLVGVGVCVGVAVGVGVRVGVADAVLVGVAADNVATGVAAGVGPQAASSARITREMQMIMLVLLHHAFGRSPHIDSAPYGQFRQWRLQLSMTGVESN